MCLDIVKKEVRFAWHLPKNTYRDIDLHYVRMDLTCKCGNIIPKTTFIKDFKRDIYVTKKTYQNHKDKKEFEEIEKLNKQETTQSDINLTVANMLGMPHLASQPDQLKNSPYVYGYDITSTSLIKLLTLKKNNFIQSFYSVAAFDIETNPLTNEIIMATIAYQGKTYTAVLAKFLKNIPDPVFRIKKSLEKFLPKYKDMEFEIKLHANEVDLLKDIFRVANEWKPVFLAIWNMDFDISRILECLKRCNVNPIDVICDQSIPRDMRVCRYRQGLKKKVTASGVVKPINPSLQWHTLISTSTFYIIDAMCAFRQLRMAQAERPSYSLDAILKEQLNTQKLKFKEAEKYKGINEHIFLQENYPIEYIVYHFYDCLSMLELDEKNKDLAAALPSFAGITDFQKFNSQVRKVTDNVYLFGLEKNLIIGTAGKIKEEVQIEADEIDDALLNNEDNDEAEENDPSKYTTLDLKGWIQLLPQNLLIHDGLKHLEDYLEVVTNVRGLTFDLDASAAYPSCTLVSNTSKATCVNEFISIEGIPEEVFRQQNLSICLGNANMLEYFNIMFDLPPLDIIDELLDKVE